MNNSHARPLSVLVIGWSSIIVSIVMIVWELYSFSSHTSLEQMGLNPALLARYFPEAAHIVDDLNRSVKIWTVIDVVYFAFVLAASIQFLRLRLWGRNALEVACWVGLVLSFVAAVQDYMHLKNMEAMMSTLLSRVGLHQSFVNPFGTATIVLGLVFWLVICSLMVFFLRRPKVRDAVNLQ